MYIILRWALLLTSSIASTTRSGKVHFFLRHFVPKGFSFYEHAFISPVQPHSNYDWLAMNGTMHAVFDSSKWSSRIYITILCSHETTFITFLSSSSRTSYHPPFRCLPTNSSYSKCPCLSLHSHLAIQLRWILAIEFAMAKKPTSLF